MSQERDHEMMERGSQAALVAGYVREVVDELFRDKVTLLIAQYRQGKADFPMLLGTAAELAALEGLMSELENRERRAAAAAERELNRGQK